MSAQADARALLQQHPLAHTPSAYTLDLVSEIGEVVWT
jgi:hypothetical protein